LEGVIGGSSFVAENSGRALVVLLLCVSRVKSRDLSSSEAEDTGRKISPLDCAVDGTTDGREGVFRRDGIFVGGPLALLSVMGFNDGVVVSI